MSEEVVLGHAAEAGTDFLIYTSNYCGYCTAAKRMFEQKNLTFKEINFDENPQIRNDVVAATGRRTVPVIFDLRGDAPMYIGGFDETSRYLRK
jgi:glutaredoxin 3